MNTELRLTVAAIAATLPLLSAGAAQTINFGPNRGLPAGGTVPDGYAGFDWHGAMNGGLLTRPAPISRAPTSPR